MFTFCIVNILMCAGACMCVCVCVCVCACMSVRLIVNAHAGACVYACVEIVLNMRKLESKQKQQTIKQTKTNGRRNRRRPLPIDTGISVKKQPPKHYHPAVY